MILEGLGGATPRTNVHGTWYERLNPVDATFLYIENSRAHMHVGGVFVVEGTAPSHRELVSHVASRLARVPRYRQRVRRVPFDAGRPVWVDDATFRAEDHVRHAVVRGEEELKLLAARVFGMPLDPEKPLWELTLVDGVGDDRFALVWKTHHCMLDGVAFVQVITAFTDADATVRPSVPAPPWSPRPTPSGAQLLSSTVEEQLAGTGGLVRSALRATVDRRSPLLDLVSGARPLVDLALRGRARPSSLNERIGPDRRWEMLSVDLTTLKAIRSALGGTVNDVMLAVVTGALRDVLSARGEILDDLRAFIPVNVRSTDARATGGNQIGGIYCPLPIREADPVSRLHDISASMARLKETRAALGTAWFVRLGELVHPLLAAQLARSEVAYRRFNLIVSNVAGPDAPRYLLGRKLLSLHFAVPLPDEQTLSIQFFSYAGNVGLGLLADARRVPDLRRIACAMSQQVAELLAACPRTAAHAG